VDSGDTSRNKQRYKITKQGIDVLRDWASSPINTEVIRLELLMKLYFSNHANPKKIINQIDAFYKKHHEQLSLLKQFQKELQNIPDPYHNHMPILDVIAFGIETNQAYLTSCERIIKRIQGENE
jgi:DNA-binding PadR family transcriptional regulator